MSRRPSAVLTMLCAILIAPAATAQGNGQASADPTEAFLERLGLTELRAVYLRQQLERAPLDERLALADRLATLYAQMLDEAADRNERDRIAGLARDLLERVPESRSFDLRINLAKARYLIAEEIAERHRVRLADEDEVSEALGILREVAQQLDLVGDRVHRRVEDLERQERRARDEDEERIDAMLTDARRLRSLARYYAGWARYYSAFLSESPAPAQDALQDFAWILGSPGERVPDIEKVSRNLMRFEHVARAALGTALCYSVRDDAGQALRWLDLIENAEELPEDLRDEIFAHRVGVLANAGRWSDIEWLLHRRSRTVSSGEPVLSVGEARLLAVLTLEAQGAASRPEQQEIITLLGQVALGELVRAREVGHVLDLVQRYDAVLVGQDGFIVRYVTALRAYREARDAHAAAGEDEFQPAHASVLQTRYRQCADLFAKTLNAEDTEPFSDELERVRVLQGMSLFYGGDLARAADAFEELASTARDPRIAEDALWHAILALDELDDAQKERRDRLAALYLATYPRNDRAIRLVLERAGSDIVDPEEAARILLSVSEDSPLREVATRYAATLLYRVYRSTSTNRRDFAALRFMEVAEESIARDLDGIRDLDDEQLLKLARELVVRLRQILDASLSMSPPDITRARWALLRIDEVASLASMDLSDIAEELAYRRFQLALAQGNEPRALRELAMLRSIGGRYSDAADRFMYQRAAQAWRRNPQDTALAREVVAHGSRVMAALRSGQMTMDNPALQSLADRIAEAARVVFDAEQDEVMRDVALRLDRELLDAGVRPASVLERFAVLSESAGRLEDALDAWRTLLAALAPDSESWYRARYHSLRLLAEVDPSRAREVLEQFKILHADPASQPQPWGEKIAELDRTIPPASPTGGPG